MASPVRRAAAAIALGAAIVLAWFVPPLAIPLVWPLLLIAPGWAILSMIPSRIDLAGRIGLAVVLSVAMSTHIVFWFSHVLGGYGRAPIFAAAALLAIPVTVTVATAPLQVPRLRPRWPALVLASAAAAVVGLVLGIGIWRETPEGISSGGSNWSDLGVHLSIAETLNAGSNFPPEVPYFAGVPLVYHWFADFHAAILAEAATIFAVPAMVAQSALLAASLALLVWSLARWLGRSRAATRVALVAGALAVFGGGLGYVRFLGDLTAGASSAAELIANNSYDNQWLTGAPYFRIPSVMGTGLLAHRATTAGLPLLVGAVLLLVHGLPRRSDLARGARDRPALIALAGMSGALLAPFHFFFFPVLPLLALAWVVAGRRLRGPHAPRNAALLLAPYVLSLPFVVQPILQASGSGALKLVAGWASVPSDGGAASAVFFYVTNLGVPFVLAIGALTVRRLPHRAFLASWIVALFVVPNVIQVSVIDFDMNKYFQAMWIAVAVAAACLVARWPGWAVAAVIALSIPSPLLVAAWTATSNLQVLSAAEARAMEWVRSETPAGAVFVTDGWVNSLTDAAGRKRLTTFGPYVANLGFDPDGRIADVASIYCGGDVDASAALMRRYGAAYVVDGTRPQPCERPVDFASSAAFVLVYGEGPLIWRLAD